ncbi:MAG: hypothetical protein HYV42_05045 [Candidatus Magasanikbacteria bacterium]|nr:hypothetical protein [Candidatus Magasanikbacteria bacterium]
MNLGLAERYFNLLYADIDGYRLSAAGKQHWGQTPPKELTYGEVNFASFPALLAAADAPPGGTFYDLGSGTGKAVILAALLGNFRRLVGIELIPELYQTAAAVREKFNQRLRPALPQSYPEPDINFRSGDIFTEDWSEADVIFVQATCFSENLLTQLTERCQQLKPGSRIISVTATLDAPFLTCFHTDKFALGWGLATVWYYVRN